MSTKKKNPRIGGDVIADIKARMKGDPAYAAMVQEEFDRLELARKVRQAREAKGLSQEKLAQLVGTKQPAIARLENGRAIPGFDLLKRIARAVGMRLEIEFKPVTV